MLTGKLDDALTELYSAQRGVGVWQWHKSLAVKAERAAPTSNDNLLLHADERIVIVRLFVSQDPHKTKNLGINLASN